MGFNFSWLYSHPFSFIVRKQIFSWLVLCKNALRGIRIFKYQSHSVPNSRAKMFRLNFRRCRHVFQDKFVSGFSYKWQVWTMNKSKRFDRDFSSLVIEILVWDKISENRWLLIFHGFILIHFRSLSENKYFLGWFCAKML